MDDYRRICMLEKLATTAQEARVRRKARAGFSLAKDEDEESLGSNRESIERAQGDANRQRLRVDASLRNQQAADGRLPGAVDRAKFQANKQRLESRSSRLKHRAKRLGVLAGEASDAQPKNTAATMTNEPAPTPAASLTAAAKSAQGYAAARGGSSPQANAVAQARRKTVLTEQGKEDVRRRVGKGKKGVITAKQPDPRAPSDPRPEAVKRLQVTEDADSARRRKRVAGFDAKRGKQKAQVAAVAAKKAKDADELRARKAQHLGRLRTENASGGGTLTSRRRLPGLERDAKVPLKNQSIGDLTFRLKARKAREAASKSKAAPPATVPAAASPPAKPALSARPSAFGARLPTAAPAKSPADAFVKQTIGGSGVGRMAMRSRKPGSASMKPAFTAPGAAPAAKPAAPTAAPSPADAAKSKAEGRYGAGNAWMGTTAGRKAKWKDMDAKKRRASQNEWWTAHTKPTASRKAFVAKRNAAKKNTAVAATKSPPVTLASRGPRTLNAGLGTAPAPEGRVALPKPAPKPVAAAPTPAPQPKDYKSWVQEGRSAPGGGTPGKWRTRSQYKQYAKSFNPQKAATPTAVVGNSFSTPTIRGNKRRVAAIKQRQL